MKFPTAFAIMALITTSFSNVALARERPLHIDQVAHENRVTLSFVVPFGRNSNSARSQPRMELQVSDWRREDHQLNIFRPRDIVNKRSIGLSLDRKPQFLLNGRQYVSPAADKNVSTAGGIAIGVGVLAALGAVMLIGIDQEFD